MSSAGRTDVLVIGAGHNGLTAAALLARAGRSVVVAERAGFVGGLAATAEFHPGYHDPGLLWDTGGVRPGVIAALGLERHGLALRERPAGVLALGPDGGLLLHGAPERAVEEIGRLSKRDAESYRGFRAFVAGVRDVLGRWIDEPPLDPTDPDALMSWAGLRFALGLRRLGRGPLLELLRVPPMPVADWLGEWFETDALRAALALPALGGTFLGPRSPGSAANLLLREAAAGPGVSGGAPALVQALERAARDAGATLRTGAEVERILLGDDGSVRGVVLRGGEELHAPVVAASCDPKRTLLRLVPPGRLSRRTEQRIHKLRTRGTTARVLLAVCAPVEFAGRPGKRIELARAVESIDDLERAFDVVKYRAFPERPALEIHVATVSRPELAPDGHDVVSVLVHFAPYELDGEGWTDAARERLGDRVVRTLDRYAPGIEASVLGREVLAPPDLETRYALTGGHLHHGEHALDQLLVRPTPECSRYRTPIPGLYLCGSGSHPGGGLTCGPGAQAARAILGRT